MSAIIYSADKRTAKSVRNLGWLLRNWRDVARFEVLRASAPEVAKYPEIAGEHEGKYLEGRKYPEGILVAYLHDGREYRTLFACLTVCRSFLDRPVFRGLPLTFLGEETSC